MWNDWAGLSVSKQGSEIGRNAGRTRDRDTGIALQSKRYNKRGGDRHCGVITDVKREIYHADDVKREMFVYISWLLTNQKQGDENIECSRKSTSTENVALVAVTNLK